jgi:hypothetical protein
LEKKLESSRQSGEWLETVLGRLQLGSVESSDVYDPASQAPLESAEGFAERPFLVPERQVGKPSDAALTVGAISALAGGRRFSANVASAPYQAADARARLDDFNATRFLEVDRFLYGQDLQRARIDGLTAIEQMRSADRQADRLLDAYFEDRRLKLLDAKQQSQERLESVKEAFRKFDRAESLEEAITFGIAAGLDEDSAEAGYRARQFKGSYRAFTLWRERVEESLFDGEIDARDLERLREYREGLFRAFNVTEDLLPLPTLGNSERMRLEAEKQDRVSRSGSKDAQGLPSAVRRMEETIARKRAETTRMRLEDDFSSTNGSLKLNARLAEIEELERYLARLKRSTSSARMTAPLTGPIPPFPIDRTQVVPNRR